MSDPIRWCLTHEKKQAIVGACEACFNEHGYMKYMAYQCEIVTMVRTDQSLVVESDVPDGQGYDWVIAQVPKAGRYAVVPVDAAIGGNDE